MVGDAEDRDMVDDVSSYGDLRAVDELRSWIWIWRADDVKGDDLLGEAVGHRGPGADVATEAVSEDDLNGVDRVDGGLQRAGPQREGPLGAVYELESAHRGRRREL